MILNIDNIDGNENAVARKRMLKWHIYKINLEFLSFSWTLSNQRSLTFPHSFAALGSVDLNRRWFLMKLISCSVVSYYSTFITFTYDSKCW